MTQKCHSLGFFVLLCLVFCLEGRTDESSEEAKNRAGNIEWRGSAGCQDRERLVSELETLLGRDTIAQTPLKFSGSALFQDTAWEARLETIVDEKTLVRSVHVGSCDSALKVVALLIALTLDPLAALSAEDEILESLESVEQIEMTQQAAKSSEGASDPFTPPQITSSKSEKGAGDLQKNRQSVPDEKEATGRNDLKQKTTPKTNPLLGVNVSAVADFGTVPSFGIGFAAGGELRFRFLYGKLALRYVPPRRTALSGVEQARLRTWLLTTVAGVGGIIELSPFSLIPQIGIFFHTIGSETEGIAQTRSDRAYFFAPWLGCSVEWNITRQIGIFVHPAVHISLRRPRFEIAGVGSVHQVSLVTASLEFGIFFLFNHRNAKTRPLLK